MNTEQLYFERTDLYQVFIGHQPTIKNCPYVGECYLKTDDGNLKHLITRYGMFKQEITHHLLLEETSDQGHVSKRPYKPGQRCDGSIDAPVMVLIDDFLATKGLDVVAIMNEAYPYEDPHTAEDLQASIEFGRWQGVKIPTKWSENYYNKLLQSIAAVNMSDLKSYFIENF